MIPSAVGQISARTIPDPVAREVSAIAPPPSARAKARFQMKGEAMTAAPITVHAAASSASRSPPSRIQAMKKVR